MPEKAGTVDVRELSVVHEQSVTACRACTGPGVYREAMYSPYIPGGGYREAYSGVHLSSHHGSRESTMRLIVPISPKERGYPPW